ncbi:hypothetical protein PspKH34_11720 [Parageobacillus sp. KH3-4]|nr:hypothetical protein PspKH34_11720 [Parageobacillus sp. KH3-4]
MDGAESDGGNDDNTGNKDNVDNDDNMGNDDTGSIRQSDTFQIVFRPYQIPPLIFRVIMD